MSQTILIVEDDRLILKLLNDLLQAEGYATIQSFKGENILENSRKRRPDLILMDIQLPEQSGLELTKLFKADEKLNNIPVIALTAFAVKGDEEKARAAGCNDFMSKPISVPKFLQTITKHLM